MASNENLPATDAEEERESPLREFRGANLGEYKTRVGEQVHRTIAALQHVQTQANGCLGEYYAERDEIVRRFVAAAQEHNAKFQEWIDGTRTMTLMEEREFVPNRWVPADNTKQYKGIPGYWGRILNRLPFFEPTAAEMEVLGHVRTVEVQRVEGCAVEGGWKEAWHVQYVYEPNEWVSKGAEVLVEYVAWGTFPRGRLEQCAVTVVRDNVWKKRVVEEHPGLSFFDVFSTDPATLDKRFVHLLTLCSECVPNQLYWFNETVLQKKNMQNLGWNPSPEYDLSSQRHIDDKYDFPCVQQ